MAKGYSAQTVGVLDGTLNPAAKADGRVYGARLRNYRATFDLSQATVARNVGDTNVICKRPAATAFRSGSVVVSATLGSSTIAVGTAAVPAKYSAQTAYTTTDVPAGFGKTAAKAEAPIADAEEVIFTVAGATLPSSGFIVIDFETSAR